MYFLTTEGEGTAPWPVRPTQADIKDRGPGIYLLLRNDGSLIKRFTVTTNRKQGLNLVTSTTDGLEGVTTLHLERLAKAYITVVKYWPAKTGDARKIAAEIERRSALLAEIAKQGNALPVSA